MTVPSRLDREWVLPPHAAEVFAIFGFPHGADCCDCLWWRTYDDGTIHLFAQCSDTFAWGTADCEEITQADMPLLRQCLADLREADEMYLTDVLFAARKRGMRPMRLFLYGNYNTGKPGVPDEKSLPLFEAAGPERDPRTEG